MRRVVPVAAVAACVVAITAPGAAAAPGPGWSVVPTPSPAGATESALFGVACSSAGACTAVGYFQASNRSAPLAERWDGTAFSVQPVPRAGFSSMLHGVSCPAANACTAVGASRIFTGGGEFRFVPLAERWDGTAWSIQPLPGSGVAALYGVSCPAVSDCTAVGAGGAEQWNGSAWSPEPVPSPPGAVPGTVFPRAVSCPAPSACIAVGSFSVSTSSSSGLRPLAERWDGSAWSVLPVPTPAGGGALDGVSCSAATACTAVGGHRFSPQGLSVLTLAERWNGTAWSIQPTPTPLGAGDAGLSGVSCPAATACTAAGAFGNPPGSNTLAEHWDGTAWSIQPTPNPGRGDNFLDTVACPAPATCLATGTQLQRHSFFALGERFGP